jgi:hypothetical protein
MAHGDPAKLREVSISLDFGVFKLETTWAEDPRQRNAAWALYVELVTRVATQELDLDGGLIREALSSLHDFFPVTRAILRAEGPVVGAAPSTVGGIALLVVNRGIRPFLSKWHPLLVEWEASRGAGIGARQHERAWPREVECRAELEKLRRGLNQYAVALGRIAGVIEP